jgi:hypothetical protein
VLSLDRVEPRRVLKNCGETEHGEERGSKLVGHCRKETKRVRRVKI